MTTDVSFILPVYNKAEALPAFLKSLRNQQGAFQAEYIFVDDTSSDDSLAVLRSYVAGWHHVTIIENAENAGPSIRLNQGADRAVGTYLALFDCDEILAPNAIETLMGLAQKHDADMVHGKCTKTAAAPDEVEVAPISVDVVSRVFDKPVERAIGRGMVRMTWLVKRDVFVASGGCDPRIFVQDESLVLRLAYKAQRIVDSDAVVTVAPEAGTHLSNGKLQQQHDAFFAYHNFLTDHPDLPTNVRKRLVRKCISTARKVARHKNAPGFPGLTAKYIFSKLGYVSKDPASLSGVRNRLLALPGIRRTGKR